VTDANAATDGNGATGGRVSAPSPAPSDNYRWIALSNATLGILMAVINQSIVIIALPAIFRGIHLNPLIPSNTSYLLWMLLGFMVVMAVLVVSLGRVGDMFGRVRMYNLGFAVFTAGSIVLSVTWMQGSAGALWMIVMRIVQGIGAAFLMANSSAILTDAFPAGQRGLALGINMVAAIAGSSVGFLVAGPISGRLADHFGARPFATGGMILSAIGFLLLVALPVNFDYWEFGLVILLIGAAMGMFAAPNLTGIMNSLPPDQRGSGAGMAATFQNSATVLSIGVFFSLIIVGLSSTLPGVLYHGLASNGVPHVAAHRVAGLPPVGSMFASFLGYNPVGTLLAPELGHLPHGTAVYLTGHRFFPALVSHPFASGIHTVFYFAAGCCLVAAVASWLRGGKYYYKAAAPEPKPVSAELAIAESSGLTGPAVDVHAGID